MRLKIETMQKYSPSGKAECLCGEARLPVLTLSHLAPTPEFQGRGEKLYATLKKAGYPALPVMTECMNCNIMRDNWGNGYGPVT